MISAARAITAVSGSGRETCQTRLANSSTGQSYACACTSCGKQTVTAPVSAGSVSTRIAEISAAGSCSGRQIRSKYLLTGRNASFTVTSPAYGSSSSCSNGEAARSANVSAGSSSTGIRLMVASAAPVTMFVAPGPDRAGDRVRLQPVPHPGERDRGVHHGLLVAAQHVRQRARLVDLGLQQRLAQTGHVAVTEDAEAALEELVLDSVGLAVLLAQELHGRLGDGEVEGLTHDQESSVVSRGSTGWSAQVPRTQVWSGWSEIFQARSPPSGFGGPAITFR